MTEARVVIGDYRDEYNRARPHGGLGYLSPDEFATRQARDRRKRSPGVSAPWSTRSLRIRRCRRLAIYDLSQFWQSG